MNPGPRFAAFFRWVNTHLGWWSFVIFVAAAIATYVMANVIEEIWTESCTLEHRAFDENQCIEDSRLAGIMEVGFIALVALLPVLLTLPIQFLRNHLRLRQDRTDFTARWQLIKDQYSRGAYDALDDMGDARRLRDGDHMPTHQWTAGRTASAVGLVATVTAATFLAFSGIIAFDGYCDTDYEDQAGCEAYKTVWKISFGIAVPVLVGAIFVMILGFSLRALGRHGRQRDLVRLEEQERKALDRLRTKP